MYLSLARCSFLSFAVLCNSCFASTQSTRLFLLTIFIRYAAINCVFVVISIAKRQHSEMISRNQFGMTRNLTMSSLITTRCSDFKCSPIQWRSKNTMNNNCNVCSKQLQHLKNLAVSWLLFDVIFFCSENIKTIIKVRSTLFVYQVIDFLSPCHHF